MDAYLLRDTFFSIITNWNYIESETLVEKLNELLNYDWKNRLISFSSKFKKVENYSNKHKEYVNNYGEKIYYPTIIHTPIYHKNILIAVEELEYNELNNECFNYSFTKDGLKWMIELFSNYWIDGIDYYYESRFNLTESLK